MDDCMAIMIPDDDNYKDEVDPLDVGRTNRMSSKVKQKLNNSDGNLLDDDFEEENLLDDDPFQFEDLML